MERVMIKFACKGRRERKESQRRLGSQGERQEGGRVLRYGGLKGSFLGSETRSEEAFCLSCYYNNAHNMHMWDEGEGPGDLVVDYVAISFGQTNPEILSTPGFVYKIHQ